jgi:hypothetical protein
VNVDRITFQQNEKRRKQQMSTSDLNPELERRLKALEDPSQQGEDYDAASWFWLLLLGLVLPVIVLIWGWQL